MGYRAIALLIGLPLFTGCYSTVQVAPDELPKLNGAYSVTKSGYGINPATGQPGTVAVKETSVIAIKNEKGRLVEVQGKPRVRLILRSGEIHLFRPPILSEIKNGVLTLESANHPPIDVALTDVDEVHVLKPDMVKTILLSTGLTVVGAVVIFAIVSVGVTGGT